MERPYRPLIRETGFRKALREICRFSFYPFLAAALLPLYGLRVRNRRRLRGPAISVMNHCIYPEWFFLWHAVRPHYIRFTAEEENMRRRDLGWFNYLLGVVGIPASSPMGVAPAVDAAISRGELIHFFPEGVLKSRSQAPGAFFIGAAWFACRHNVPLIPVAEILHPRRIQRWLPAFPPRVELIVGEPMYPDDYRESGETLRKTAGRMTQAAEGFIRTEINSHSVETGS